MERCGEKGLDILEEVPKDCLNAIPTNKDLDIVQTNCPVSNRHTESINKTDTASTDAIEY
jgi:hypothetical protein